MTKEELKQEAEESFEQYKVTDEDYVVSPYSDDMGEKMLMYNDEYYAEETYLRLYTEGYLAGAEPREKQIQIDAEQIRALQKQNGELTDKVKKLEEEIAELKKLKRECETSLCRAEYQYNYEQLTKAKELLKRYVPYRQITNSIAYKDLADETEQFLNSEVEK